MQQKYLDERREKEESLATMREQMDKEIDRYREEAELHKERVHASQLELERIMSNFQQRQSEEGRKSEVYAQEYDKIHQHFQEEILQRDSTEKHLRGILDDKTSKIEEFTMKLRAFEEKEQHWLESERALHSKHQGEVNELRETIADLKAANDEISSKMNSLQAASEAHISSLTDQLEYCKTVIIPGFEEKMIMCERDYAQRYDEIKKTMFETEARYREQILQLTSLHKQPHGGIPQHLLDSSTPQREGLDERSSYASNKRPKNIFNRVVTNQRDTQASIPNLAQDDER